MLPLIIAIGAAAFANIFTGDNLLDAKQAKLMIRSGKIKKVIDVRTMAEYRGGLHIPVNKINKKTTAELPKRGLLVYCNTGQRDRFAAEKLEELGFEDVYYIAGHYSTLQ